MRKLILAVVVALCFFGVQGAYAACAIGTVNCNENTNTNTATNGNVTGSVTDNSKTTSNSSANNNGNGNGNGNGNNDGNIKNSGNSSSTSSIKNSGNSSSRSSSFQAQGQQQQSSQANGQTLNDGNNKYYGNAWPSVTAAEGTSSGTASTLFGSLGIADTEKYKKIQVILQTLAAEVQAGLVSKDDIAPYVTALNIKLMGTVKTQRTLLGLGPETSGKNLLNVLGLLTADSFYKDGAAQGGDIMSQQQAATTALDTTETNKDVTTGNGGNLPAGEQK